MCQYRATPKNGTTNGHATPAAVVHTYGDQIVMQQFIKLNFLAFRRHSSLWLKVTLAR